jgi:hypothetical protein
MGREEMLYKRVAKYIMNNARAKRIVVEYFDSSLIEKLYRKRG